MYRLMQPEDKPAVLALWQSQRNESEEFAKKAIEQFAGEQNVYVAEENDEIAAVALAVPVTLQGRQRHLPVRSVRRGQPDPGGPCRLSVCPAEAARRGLYGGGAHQPGASRTAAG